MKVSCRGTGQRSQGVLTCFLAKDLWQNMQGKSSFLSSILTIDSRKLRRHKNGTVTYRSCLGKGKALEILELQV
jgi:hypothetical protein